MTRNKNTSTENTNQRSRRHRKVNKLIAERRNAVVNEMELMNVENDHMFSPPSEINTETPINDLIRSWVNCHGITTRAVNDLLGILNKAGTENLIFFIGFLQFSGGAKTYGGAKGNTHLLFSVNFKMCEILMKAIFFVQGLSKLPKDYRTLLQTPKTVEISEVAGGKYWYNGIERNLRLVFSKLNKDISIALNFNMDGLPIFKSSKRVFWPILSTIYSN